MSPTICAILFVSAAMKTLYAGSNGAISPSLGISFWIMIAVIETEWITGFLLLSGYLMHFAWTTAICLFSAFAVSSFIRASAGYDSCGCFGPIKVHPWWTLALDLAVIVLLVARRKKFVESSQLIRGRWRPFAAATGFVLLGGASLAVMLRSAPTALGDGMSASTDGSIVVLEPAEWVGKAFPLMNHMAPGAELASGEWIVVLYHHDCPKCQEALPRYERLAEAASTTRGPKRVLLVETPPFGDADQATGQAVRARLSPDREWFVQAPVEIQLNNGNVTLASLELPSVSRQ